MRKTVSMLLAVVAAASSISIHEAAAQSRGDNKDSASISRGASGEFRSNYRYERFCMPTVNGGRLYNEDMRGWRRVANCKGYKLMD
ncbi:hypothetical protein [Pararhizobium arenae]|uniref:hypothetical protein n=1 Tax=Pararhizobium arenae TaxID=1856850 RepID=UPI00094B01DE|nr:hypothetical protein [Pararhizobium arenae]